MTHPITRFLQVLIILLTPLVLVLGSVRLLATNQYLSFEYGKLSFPPDRFGFDREQRLVYASASFRYVRECQPLKSLADQRIGNHPLYNDRELKHMQNVHDVYQIAGQVWFLSIILITLSGLALFRQRESRTGLASALQLGGLLTSGLIVIVGFLAIVFWQKWFVVFHQVFFLPGTWSFNTSDTLIRLFPEMFWFDTALTLSGLTLAGGLLLAFTGWWLKLKQ